tara:strand:- start:92 stop:307 length:216 start_codon:yes stop_codon:yes gene_type:complete
MQRMRQPVSHCRLAHKRFATCQSVDTAMMSSLPVGPISRTLPLVGWCDGIVQDIGDDFYDWQLNAHRDDAI